MHISTPRDAGNIEIIEAKSADNIRLNIRVDTAADHRQWFDFIVHECANKPLTIRIENAHATSYAKAWDGYTAVYSEDGETWLRAAGTRYEGGALIIEHTSKTDRIEFAYFAPYRMQRHDRLIASAGAKPGVQLVRLGSTIDQDNLDLVRFGKGPKQIWIVARQHPGESMAEWWVEGFLHAMFDPANAVARTLREQATFHVVPNMNPDGSRLGNLRTNAAGANLNREWHEPTMERSCEVKLVRDEMDRTDVHLCLDVHGDEVLPYNFIAGAEGIIGWTAERQALQDRFIDEYVLATPDFQREFGYEVDKPESANMTMCTNQVAARFGCLSLTLEQPFKDTANQPMPGEGWSPRRAKQLGASVLQPISRLMNDLTNNKS